MRAKITSVSNPRIKQLVRLRKRSQRDALQLILIDGIRELQRALDAQVVIKELFVCPELVQDYQEPETAALIEKQLKDKTVVYEVTESIFNKIGFGERKEGVLAVGEIKKKDLAQVELSKNPCILVVEDVEKPGNLGAILRTCDGAGIDAVFICQNRTDIYNPNVIRASLGTVFTNQVIACTNTEAQDFLQDRQIRVVAATPEAECIYTKVNLKDPVAVVVGREDKGLSEQWMKIASEHVRIPMKGQADSLNVSVSTGLLLYETLRQREN